MSDAPIKVGIIGCGNISNIYLPAGQKFRLLNVVACADIIEEAHRR